LTSTSKTNKIIAMTQFNSSGCKFCVAITGGGSRFISDCLESGGASEWLVEASIPYSTESLEDYIGGVREKYCSESTARQLAVAAEIRGNKLGHENVIGVGVTCALARVGGEREGREHWMHYAAVSGGKIISLSFKFPEQIHKREQQEEFAAQVIKYASGGFAEHVSGKLSYEEMTLEIPGIEFKKYDQTLNNLVDNISERGYFFWNGNDSFKAIYSGSFNPWHEGHQYAFDQAEKVFGKGNVAIEVSIGNKDKPNIDLIELEKRLNQFKSLDFPHLIVTNAPLFQHKARLFPDKDFVVGYDTFERIEEDFWRIYDNDFLVIPRNGKKVEELPHNQMNIRKESFEITEGPQISSRELRK
jgi:nicotinic acid mononucleotide adenylyltransferase